MNKTLRNSVMAGWIISSGLGLAGKAAAADSADTGLRITVYVNNYAQVEPETLARAKEVAARIFGKAGVETVILDGGSFKVGQANEVRFFVNILTRQMAEQMSEKLGLPTNIAGVAAGTSKNQRSRKYVYIFDHVVKRIARDQMKARVEGKVSFHADKGQVLGHAMAHEIGHVLLNLASHSPKGLMRANWDQKDLQSAATGQLLFTPEQAELIRTEVILRDRQEKTLEVAAL